MRAYPSPTGECHRRFTVVSGSEDPSKPDSAVSWDALARTGGTLVVLMGWKELEGIVEALQGNGMDPETPAALVQWGTWPGKRPVTGRLEDIVSRGREAGLQPPVVAIVGKVVELREQLRWFDDKPLWGKKVLITRSRSQASRLKELLTGLGADPIELPTIQTMPLEDYAELDGALERLADFGWVFFASANAVEAVFCTAGCQGHAGMPGRSGRPKSAPSALPRPWRWPNGVSPPITCRPTPRPRRLPMRFPTGTGRT